MGFFNDTPHSFFAVGLSTLALLMLGAFAGPNTATAQEAPELSFPLTVSTDAGGTQELSLGLDPEATAGIDTSLGEAEQPPLPPSDIFDARLIDDDIPPTGFGEGLVDDFRDGSASFAGTKEHEIQVSPDSGATEATIAWDLPTGVTGTLTDVITDGGIVNEPMEGSGSFTLTNLDVNKLFVTLEYSGSANQPPEATGDSYSTTQDSALSITDPADGVLANDADPDGDSLTASLVSGVSSGTLALNADGTFDYTPDSGFTGTDQFTYEASDGAAADTATATIEVESPENQPPTAENDSFVTVEGQALTVSAPGVLGNDIDPDGDALSASVVSGVSDGTLTLDADGSLEYVPDSGFTGTDQFTYEASDGAAADTAAVVIAVQPDDGEAEVQFPITVSTDDGDSQSLDLGLDPGATDGIDPGLGEEEQPPLPPSDIFDARLIDDDIPPTGFGEGLLTDIRAGSADFTGIKEHEVKVQPGEGASSVTVSWALPQGVTGQLQDATTGGDIVNEPMTGSGSFTYENLNVTELLVTLEYGAPNTPPEASDDNYTTVEGQILQVGSADGVLANDSDPDGDDLTASIVSGTTNGTLTLNPDGSFSYGPEEGFTGTDSFTYEAVDGRGGTAQATATIEVQPEQPADLAIPFTVTADTSVEQLTMGLDPDATDGIDPELGEEEQPPLPPSDVFDARWIDDDVPASGFGEGILTDIRPGDTSFVGTKVHEVNVQPGGAAEEVTFSWNLPPGVTGTLEDVVTDGDEVSVPMDGEGSFTLTNLNITKLYVTLEYTLGNAPPEAAPDNYTISEDSTVTVPPPGVLGNDTEPDGDSLAASLVSGVSNGTLTLDAEGSFSYDPDSDFVGTDSFTYEAADPQGRSDQATVTIVVNGVPTASDDSFATDEDQALTVSAPGVLENDSDPDGDSLAASLVSGASSGTLTIGADGSLEYTPDSDFNGTDGFVYASADPSGAADTAAVTLTVEPVNDPPTATDDNYATVEDSVLSVTNPTEGVLANDSDIDGDPVAASVVEDPSNGTLTLDANGTFEYTPDTGFADTTDTFVYEAADGNEGTDRATVSIAVASADNNPPVAAADSFGTEEGQPLDIGAPGVLENDSDPDGESLTASVVDAPLDGSLTLDEDGSFEYTPDSGFSGTDTFVYEAGDGNGATDQAEVTITVEAVNDPPVAEGDAYDTPEDQTLSVTQAGSGVLGNDTDPDGETLTVSVVSGVSNGALTLNEDGTFDYAPDANFNGEDEFTYEVSDGASADTATATLTVVPVNDPPVATADSFGTPAGQSLTVEAPGLLGNDTDPDADSLTASQLTGTSNGTLTLNADGSLEYTPDAGFSGTDSFFYSVADTAEASGGPSQEAADQAEVTITVEEPDNAPPAAVADAYDTPEDQTLSVTQVGNGVLGNDSDPDGDALTVGSLVDSTESGALTLNEDGTFDYTSDANFNGTDAFSYAVSDGASADTATATLTVVPVNDPPVATADSFGTPAGQSLTVEAPGLLGNDTDPDADSLTASQLTGTSNGTLTLNADGSLEYTPDAGFSGTDSFFYSVADTAEASGGPSQEAADQAEVTITVEEPDNAPPAAVADAYDTPEDQTLSVTQVGNGVLGNDSDPDGDALTVGSLVDSTESGALTLNEDGTFDYTSDANFNGTDAFSYAVSDGASADTATATLTVVPVNDPPVAAVDTFETSAGDTLTVEAPGALTGDTDPDGDPLTASRVTGVPNGTLDTLRGDGSFEYIPNDGFAGTDRFFYLANDGNSEQDLARTVIEVDGSASEDLQPAEQVTAVQDNYDAAQGNTRIVDSPGVLGNDEGAVFVQAVESEPENGALTMPTGETNGDGSFEYTPDDGFEGEDSFMYVASDGEGDDDTTEVFIDVGFVNTPPVAEADTFDTPEDDPLTVPAPGVLGNDSDPDGDTTLVAAKQTEASNGTVTLNSDGSLEYVPEPDFNGADNLTYTASETDGGPSRMAADNAEIQITVTPVNDAPVAAADSFETPEDQTLSVTQAGSGVLGNDSDPDGDALAVGALVDSTESGALTLNEDGTFEYEPDDNFDGTDAFAYAVEDDSSASDTAMVAIDVAGVNDAPVAAADSFDTAEDETLAVDAPGVLSNDTDPDEDSLRVSILTGPSNGTLDTLAADGSLEYVPEANFNGSDAFTYEVSDGNGENAQATVEITVTPVNDAPVAAADTFETLESDTLTVGAAQGVLSNDKDIDEGDSLAVAKVLDEPSDGTLLDTLTADGSFTYTPGSEAGSDSFTYRVVDNANGADTATVTIDVVGVNDPPVATADSFGTAEDEPLGLDVKDGFGNDSDPDGDSLRVSVLTGPSNGTLDTLATDSLTYVPTPDFNGSDSFTYQVSDGNGEADQATAEIAVTPVNDPPSVTSIADTTLSPAESTTGPLPFAIADVDNPVDSLAVSATTSDSTVVPPDSVFVADSGAERTITVNPANVSGTSTITVAVEDDSGAVATTAFEVVKNAIENVPPEVVVEIPDDTLLTPGPPLQLTGLTETVFSDPDGDSLGVSGTSLNPNVLTVSGEEGVLTLVTSPMQTGNADVVITATDDQASVSDTFNVVVDERPQGEREPASRARSFVSPSADSVGFGDTGVGANFQGVGEGEGGTVEASFFPDTTSGSPSPGQAFVAADTAGSFEFVSRYQWEITNEGVPFDSVDVAFSLENSDVVGITEPDSVTIIKDSGDGNFEAVSTTFVGADSALVGENVESFSTFKFASNDSDNPLPVELTDFTVRRDGETALVQWHTATETNNAGFGVQHQGPGAEEYAEAGYVESKAEGGTTVEPKSYRYEVAGLVPGTHRFRLRQVDIDGTGHLSETISVTVEMEEALRLTPPVPNPVRASAQLQFGLREAGEATITLYNMLGQRVATLYEGRPTPGEMQRVRLGARRLSQLSSGVYFVRLRAHGKTRTQRLVRVR